MYDETQFISKLFAETVDLWAKKDKNAIKIRKNERFFLFLIQLALSLCHETVRNVAQLVAHYVRDVGVGRSSRLIPTKGDK